MATRTRDHIPHRGDHVERLGEYLVAGLFWLGVAIAAVVTVFCGLLVLINWIY